MQLQKNDKNGGKKALEEAIAAYNNGENPLNIQYDYKVTVKLPFDETKKPEIEFMPKDQAESSRGKTDDDKPKSSFLDYFKQCVHVVPAIQN